MEFVATHSLPMFPVLLGIWGYKSTILKGIVLSYVCLSPVVSGFLICARKQLGSPVLGSCAV